MSAREKVAEAIWPAIDDDPDEPTPWTNAPGQWQQVCREQADAAIAAHLEALRPWLVELQDIARKQMLASHPDPARYFAGRVDGIRDVLEHLKAEESGTPSDPTPADDGDVDVAAADPDDEWPVREVCI